MPYKFIAIAALIGCLGQSAHAQEAVPSVGRMGDIPDAREKPDPTLDYKIVFDIRTSADAPGDISPALRSVAALINTYRHYGVQPAHLHLAAVFHGATIVLLTDDATYKARTGSPVNPNTALLGELRRAGVNLMVCGQSALAQGYDLAAIAKAAQINLSATVTFINLQTRGYLKVEE